MNGELKVYPKMWRLFAYMLPFIVTLFLVWGIYYIDRELLLAPQDLAGKISIPGVSKAEEAVLMEKLEKIEEAKTPEEIQLEKEFKDEVAKIAERPDVKGFALVIFIFMFLFSIFIEISIGLVEVVVFLKSFFRFFRYLFRGTPEIEINNTGISHWHKGDFSWDKIDKVFVDSRLNFIFLLGPWWYKKRFYSLRLILKDGGREVKITLSNTDAPIDSVCQTIKKYKEVRFGF